MGLSVHKYFSSLAKPNLGRSPIFFGWSNPEDQDLDSPEPGSPISEPETVNLEWLISYRQLCKEVNQDWAELNREIWVSLKMLLAEYYMVTLYAIPLKHSINGSDFFDRYTMTCIYLASYHNVLNSQLSYPWLARKD